MDKDLIAYLEERFRESAQQLAGFREETDRRLGENLQQLASFREENTQRLARLGEEAARQLASFRAENTRRLASLGEEAARQLASFREEAERRFEETHSRIEKVEERVRHTQIMVEVCAETFSCWQRACLRSMGSWPLIAQISRRRSRT